MISSAKENPAAPAPDDRVLENGSVITAAGGDLIHCLTIIGQIEGHYLLGDGQKATKYEHIIPLLVSIEESATPTTNG